MSSKEWQGLASISHLSSSDDELEHLKIPSNIRENSLAGDDESDNSPRNNLKSLKNLCNENKKMKLHDNVMKTHKRFSVWSEILLDEQLSEKFCDNINVSSCSNPIYSTNGFDRDCENYSYWKKKELEQNMKPEIAKSIFKKKKSLPKKKSKKFKKKSKSDKRICTVVNSISKELEEKRIDIISK